MYSHQITHMEEIVCICVVCVVSASVLPLGAAWERLGFLPVTSTGIATLVGALPSTIPHRLGVILTVPLCESESDSCNEQDMRDIKMLSG